MKPINYLSMAVAVLAMGGFTACSDDTIEVDAPDQGNGIVEVDGAATYMQIAISDPPLTVDVPLLTTILTTVTLPSVQSRISSCSSMISRDVLLERPEISCC